MGVIGKFLATRCPAQEDALLTGRLVPFFGTLDSARAGCLIAHAGVDRTTVSGDDLRAIRYEEFQVGMAFDRMCQWLGGGSSRHHSGGIGVNGRAAERGVARAGAIIRTRILLNRARRILAGVSREPVGAEP